MTARRAARCRAHRRVARRRRASGELVADFRSWAVPPAGLRHPRVPSGHLMSVQSVCLGWHWQPYAYTRTADDTDGAPVKPLPAELVELARAAVADTFGAAAGAAYAPDAAIVNLYAPGRPARAAPGRRGAVGGAGRDDQPRRHVHVPARRRRPAHRPVHRRRAALRRPARVRRSEPAHLPRRAQGPRRHRTRTGSACRRAGSASPCARRGCETSRRAGRRRCHHVVVRPFEEIVQEHGAVVMRVCRALLPPADADDAWAETFLAGDAGVSPAATGQQRARLAGDDRPPQGDRPAAGRQPPGRCRPATCRTLSTSDPMR